MAELNAAHHLSMGSNFENKQHIGWKIYLKTSTALKMRIASWEGCFIICYCIYRTFSVVCTEHVLSCLSTFFFPPHTLCSCKYIIVLKIFLLVIFPPQSGTQLLFYSSLGPLARFILMKMLGMLPSVSNSLGVSLFLLCLLVLLPLYVIWSIRTDFCIFNVPFMGKKLLGFRRALTCMLQRSTVLLSLTQLTQSQLIYVN